MKKLETLKALLKEAGDIENSILRFREKLDEPILEVEKMIEYIVYVKGDLNRLAGELVTNDMVEVVERKATKE